MSDLIGKAGTQKGKKPQDEGGPQPQGQANPQKGPGGPQPQGQANPQQGQGGPQPRGQANPQQGQGGPQPQGQANPQQGPGGPQPQGQANPQKKPGGPQPQGQANPQKGPGGPQPQGQANPQQGPGGPPNDQLSGQLNEQPQESLSSAPMQNDLAPVLPLMLLDVLLRQPLVTGIFEALAAPEMASFQNTFRLNVEKNQVECEVNVGCKGFFRPEDIEVNVNDRVLEIVARREIKSDDNFTMREVHKVLTMPENADPDKLNVEMLSNGRIMLTAPLLKPAGKKSDKPTIRINRK